MLVETNKKTDGTGGLKPLKLTVDGNDYEWGAQFITGAELRKLAKIPAGKEVYLSLEDPWDDELIGDDTKVDLARPGIEHFFVKQKLKIKIDNETFDWPKQFITGAEIRHLGKIKPEFQIFLVIKGPYEDELIKDGDRVDLARPGIEHFYGCKPNTNNG